MRQHQFLRLSIRKSFRGKKQSTSSSCQNLSSFIKSLIDLIFFLLHFLSQLLLIYKKNCPNYWIWHGLTFIIIVVLPTRAHKRKIKENLIKKSFMCVFASGHLLVCSFHFYFISWNKWTTFLSMGGVFIRDTWLNIVSNLNNWRQISKLELQ